MAAPCLPSAGALLDAVHGSAAGALLVAVAALTATVVFLQVFSSGTGVDMNIDCHRAGVREGGSRGRLACMLCHLQWCPAEGLVALMPVAAECCMCLLL